MSWFKDLVAWIMIIFLKQRKYSLDRGFEYNGWLGRYFFINKNNILRIVFLSVKLKFYFWTLLIHFSYIELICLKILISLNVNFKIQTNYKIKREREHNNLLWVARPQYHGGPWCCVTIARKSKYPRNGLSRSQEGKGKKIQRGGTLIELLKSICSWF